MEKYRTQDSAWVTIGNRTLAHLRAHPEVHKHLEEAIGKIRIPPKCPLLRVEVDMGRVVGKSGCVSVKPILLHEPTEFAIRIGRPFPSRVVLGSGEPTNRVTVIAQISCCDVGVYSLTTAWIGPLAPKEPWDHTLTSLEEYADSITFWATHALTYDPAVMNRVFESTWEEVLRC